MTSPGASGVANGVAGGAGGALDLRLTYADCDPAGIIYYAVPFVLMERVYTEWAVSHEVDPERLRQAGESVPVVRGTDGEYCSRLQIYDRVRCLLEVEGVGRSSFRWRGTIVPLGHGTRAGEPAFVGHIHQVYVGTDGRPVPVPARVRALVGAGSSLDGVQEAHQG